MNYSIERQSGYTVRLPEWQFEGTGKVCLSRKWYTQYYLYNIKQRLSSNLANNVVLTFVKAKNNNNNSDVIIWPVYLLDWIQQTSF